ncbi:MAG: MarR family winged helix-turn-helix transcriptional regulator [Actinomycetota bacterium]
MNLSPATLTPAADSLDRERYRSFQLRRALQFHGALWQREVSTEVSSVAYGVLLVLRQAPGIGQRELGQLAQLDKSTLAELLKRLELLGLISTSRDEADRRRKCVTLEDAGVDLLQELMPGALRVNELLAEGLAPDEAAQLDALLDKLLAAPAAGTTTGG